MRPLVPAALDIDTHEGRAFVGVVPFTMRDVRPLGWLPAIPGTADFHETNVRTYVHRGGRDPGVWFFSLDAANRLAVWAARRFFHLPYFHADMTMEVGGEGGRSDVGGEGDRVRYASARRRGGAGIAVDYRIGAPLGPSEPGSLQHFLAERYLLYSVDRRGRMFRGRVYHTPYPLHAASVQSLDESLLGAAGITVPSGAGPGAIRAPDLYSPGVDVEIFGLEPVPGDRHAAHNE